MVTKFERVMSKLATLGQNPRALTDCSEVIPVPAAVKLPAPTLPAGKSLKDVEAACRATPFPVLSAAPGPATTIAPVYVPLNPLRSLVCDAHDDSTQSPLLNGETYATHRTPLARAARPPSRISIYSYT